MKRGILVGFWCLFCWVVQGQPETALQHLLDTEGLRHAAIGISVKRISDGREVVAYSSETALTPASVTKLLPTVWALQEKGANYRFSTSVYYTGTIDEGILSGDIVLQASGDPCPDSRYFPTCRLVRPLVEAIEKANIHRIVDNIWVEGALDGTDIPGSWPWEDVSNYYAALYLPFNYRDNTCILEFTTGRAGTPALLKSVIPVLPDIRIISEVKSDLRPADRAWIFGGPYSSQWIVKGTLPQNRASFQVKGAIHRPAAVFVHELTEELAKKGIEVKNGAGEASPRTTLFTLASPPLKEIVFHTNKASVNLFAEALGALVAGENWSEESVNWLAKNGIPADGAILKDACGLSPADAVPARVFTDLLIHAYRTLGETFVRSLPVGGVDGGLAGYCLQVPELKNNLRAKTGSMGGVRALAGYLTTRTGESLAFAILINHYTCTTSQLQQAVRNFLKTLL